jgi:hypothetical protein
VGIRREELEGQFLSLLSRMQPTAELLAQLPERATAHWQERKSRIAESARTLNCRLTDQRTLNQKAIMAKLDGKLATADFDTVRNRRPLSPLQFGQFPPRWRSLRLHDG